MPHSDNSEKRARQFSWAGLLLLTGFHPDSGIVCEKVSQVIRASSPRLSLPQRLSMFPLSPWAFYLTPVLRCLGWSMGEMMGSVILREVTGREARSRQMVMYSVWCKTSKMFPSEDSPQLNSRKEVWTRLKSPFFCRC